MIKSDKDMLYTFFYNNRPVVVDLDVWFSSEWIEVLTPLFKTQYFAGLMYYLKHHYVNKPNGRDDNTPRTRNQIFTPFMLTKPEDIRAVLILNSPTPRSNSNGIGFGVTYDESMSVRQHERYFKDMYRRPQILDPTLISWLKQGVLVLNLRPVVNHSVPSYHNYVFNYFIKNVISVLNEKIENLIIGTVTESGHAFIDPIRSDNIIHLKSDGYFPTESSCIYSKINTQLITNGQKPIRWSSDA